MRQSRISHRQSVDTEAAAAAAAVAAAVQCDM